MSEPPVAAEPDRAGGPRRGRGPGESVAAWRRVDSGERVLLGARPHPLYILLRRPWKLAWWVVLGGAAVWAAGRWPGYVPRGGVALAWLVGLALFLAWQALEWASRRYLLTDARVVAVGGVLRQYAVDAPLRNVSHVEMHRSLAERALGLGTVAFATPGTAWAEVVWTSVEDPARVVEVGRRAIDQAAGAGRSGASREIVG